MKKLIALAAIVLSIVFFFGCEINKGSNSNEVKNVVNSNNGNNGNNGEVSSASQTGIKDYYPIQENTRYVYEGKGNEYASYDVYIDYISEGKVQRRINNGGTEMAEVIELKDGKLSRLLSKEEVYYRENLLETKGDEGEILLMEPLVKGTTWILKDSRVRTITGTSVDITTPSGSYKALEVTTEGQNDKVIDYYAKNVGLVKKVFISGEDQITSSLSKIEKNFALKQKIDFYYPDINDDKIYSKSKEVSFKTNDITKKVLAAAYKETGNNIEKVFSANTKINSLYLNKDNIVYIDLNKAFLTEMNAGTRYESMILQSIANTFGRYYNSEKVILTIDNKLYESGHIAMKKGEYIKVQ